MRNVLTSRWLDGDLARVTMINDISDYRFFFWKSVTECNGWGKEKDTTSYGQTRSYKRQEKGHHIFLLMSIKMKHWCESITLKSFSTPSSSISQYSKVESSISSWAEAQLAKGLGGIRVHFLVRAGNKHSEISCPILDQEAWNKRTRRDGRDWSFQHPGQNTESIQNIRVSSSSSAIIFLLDLTLLSQVSLISILMLKG